MIKEWDLIVLICNANNNHDSTGLYEAIGSNDFSDKANATHAAITAIKITTENVTKHEGELRHFISTVNQEQLDFGSLIRFELLKDKLDVCASQSIDFNK